MQMQVLYMLYLDFRVFQIHFQSVGGSLVGFDPSLSSPLPSYYTRDPSAPSHWWCLQLSIPTFGNNKTLSFGNFFAILIRQDPKSSLCRPHWSDLSRCGDIWGNMRIFFGGLCWFVFSIIGCVFCRVLDTYRAKHGKTPPFVIDFLRTICCFVPLLLPNELNC